MRIEDVNVPDCYTDSADFRFFLKWFRYCLEKTKFDTENLVDLYDPLRCPEWLLWLLGATVGYKFDTRLTSAYCRLVLLYFMSMIKLKGSKDGVTLAAEVNLDQFNILAYGQEKDILNNRLEDTSIPVNSVYVTPYVDKGYFDVVYFSTEKPIDACIEYVRPLGMYCFQHAGVRMDAKTEISVDARLTNTNELSISIGPTRVGHYSREDYARMQKMSNEEERNPNVDNTRKNAWYSNSDVQEQDIYAGLRTMYSLQVSNNDHMFRSLMPEIFDLGYEPQDDSQEAQDRMNTSDKFLDNYDNPKWYNLRYDMETDQFMTPDLKTIDDIKSATTSKPRVNPVMTTLGDAMTLNKFDNKKYLKKKDDKGDAEIVNVEDM